MEPTRERRNDHPERVPLRLAVELGHGDFRDPFAADALNVSKGGISMRAPCLPDLGSRLVCRFRCMPSNTLVTVQGEIVWAHLDGEQVGEFGLAFVDLDPKTEWLIEEMIAEHAAWSHDSESAAPVATLELEGSPEPIAARLSHQADGRAVFEQELDLLSLGRAVRAHAPGRDVLPGSIAAVELRMVGAVPMLAVTVAFDRAGDREGHATLPPVEQSSPGPTLVGYREGHATLPPVERSSPGPTLPRGSLRSHLGGDLAMMPLFERAQQVERAEQAAAVHDTEPDLVAPGQDPVAASEAPAAEVVQLAAAAPLGARAQKREDSAFERDFSRDFKLGIDDADDAQLEADLDAVRPSLWRPLLRALTQRGRVASAALLVVLRSLSANTSRTALPVLRGALLRAASSTRAFYRSQLAPQLGATRRVLASQLSSRRRRVTAGPGGEKHSGLAPLARTVLLGSVAAAALGLAVYAFAPTPGDEAVAVHRKMHHHAGPAPADAPEAAAATPESVPASQSEHVAAEPKSAPPVAAAPAQPTVVAAVPASKTVASAATTVTSTGEKPAASRKLRFGAARVSGGRQFSLRMSAKIQSIQGTAERDGFTVIINGALSLDRAGPLSSGHKSVSRAMVINKGDHAELNVRFSDGKQPAYQVYADGTTLYITIQDA